MTSLVDFKGCAFELQDELSTAQRIMYANLQEFQTHATQFLTYLDNIKVKKVVLCGVQLSMDELKMWQAEEKDAPEDLPRVSKREN
jgi:hypothetical protein